MLKVKIVLGLAAVTLSWIMLFRSGAIFKLNAWMRETIFNDPLVLFSGRRVAVLLLILGGVSIFSALEDVIELQPIHEHIAAKMREEAVLDFRQGHYERAVRRCRELVRSNPKDIEAWQMLADASWALGDRELARKAAASILRLDPDHPVGKSVFAEGLITNR